MKAFKFLSGAVAVVAMTFLFAAVSGLQPAYALGTTLGFGLMAYGIPTAGALFDITVAPDANSIIDDVNIYFGDREAAESNLQQTILDGRDYPNIASLRLVNGDVVQLDKAEISDVMQTFKSTFSPKGDVTLTPVPFMLRRMKFDVAFHPDVVYSKYYGFLAKMGEADRAAWPISRFIIDVLIGRKLAANQSITDWAGVYTPATSDAVAGSTLGSYDGLKTIVTKGLSDGTMNEITLTNDFTDPAKVFDAVEEAVDNLPQEYHDVQLSILMSKKQELAYFRDRRNQHGSDTNYRGESKYMTVDGRENMLIQPLNGIGRANDHGWMIITPTENLLLGRRSNSYNISVERDKREVLFMGDWTEGIGVGLAEQVFVVRPSGGSSSSSNS
jgi:hypothetical protein